MTFDLTRRDLINRIELAGACVALPTRRQPDLDGDSGSSRPRRREPPGDSPVGGRWGQYQADAANSGYNPRAAPPTAGDRLGVRWANVLDPTLQGGAALLPESFVVAGGTVFAPSTDGVLYALDARTGAVQWSLDPVDGDHLPTVPAVVGGTVYVGTVNQSIDYSKPNVLYGLDPASGEEQWRIERDDSRHGFGGPTVGAGGIYAPLDGSLVAVTADGGAERWTFSPSGRSIRRFEPPSVGDGTVYAGATGADHTDTAVYAVDVATGDRKWVYGATEHWVTGTAVGGDRNGGNRATGSSGTRTVYATDFRDHLHAIDPATGDPRWSRYLGGGGSPQNLHGPPTVANGSVYVANVAGTVRAVASDGTVRWRTSVDERTFAPPVVAGGIVYVTDDAAVHAIDAESGAKLWSQQLSLPLNADERPPWSPKGRAIALAGDAIHVQAGTGGMAMLSVGESGLRPSLSDRTVRSGERARIPLAIENVGLERVGGLAARVKDAPPEVEAVDVEGLPDAVDPDETVRGSLAFDVPARTSGELAFTVVVSGDGTVDRTVGTTVTVVPPLTVRAAQYGDGPVVAGGDLTVTFEVTASEVAAVTDAGVQPRTDDLPGEWTVGTDRPPGGYGSRAMWPDGGEWRRSPLAGVDELFWTKGTVAPGRTRTPRLTLSAPEPEAIDPGEYAMTVDAYVDALEDDARRRVDSTEVTVAVVENYADLFVTDPATPVGETETGDVSLELVVGDTPLRKGRLVVEYPSFLGVEAHEDAGGAFSNTDDTVVWEWDGRLRAGERLEPGVTFRVPDGATGGGYDLAATATASVVGVDDTATASAAGTFPVAGLAGIAESKRALAGRIDALSEGRIEETPTVESTVEGLRAAVEAGDLGEETAELAIRRLILGEEVSKRTIELVRTLDAGETGSDINYELARRTAETGAFSIAMPILVEFALARIASLLPWGVGGLVRGAIDDADEVATRIAGLLVGTGKGIPRAAAVATAEEVLGDVPGAVRNQGITRVPALKDLVTETLSPVVDLLENFFLRLVEVGEPPSADDNVQARLRFQTATLGADRIADGGVAGDQDAAEYAAWLGKQWVTGDARATDRAFRNASLDPGDVLGALVEAFTYEGGGSIGFLADLVANLVDALVQFAEDVFDLLFGGPASFGIGVTFFTGLTGQYADSVVAITDGREP